MDDIKPAVPGANRAEVALLPAFDEIADTVLNTVSSGLRSASVFGTLQNYLDGTISIGSASYKRRLVLLAIHDMKEKLEAPSSLRKRTLAQFDSLKVRPVPHLKLYRDIAMALLRLEVFMRLKSRQTSQNEQKLQSSIH